MLRAFKTTIDRMWEDPYGASPLMWRVLTEEGRKYWRSYLLSFCLMGVVAACTSFSAFMIGYLINATYLTRNFSAVVALAAATMAIFTVKGIASYGQAVLAAGIVADISTRNQRLMFEKLLQENLGYFAGRPSSKVISEVGYGAGSSANLLNLLVNLTARDALSLIGLAIVMIVQDPLMSFIAIIFIPLGLLSTRKLLSQTRALNVAAFRNNAGLFEILQETLQGMRIVKAFALENIMRDRVAQILEQARLSSYKLARLANRSGPLMEALGGFAVALAFVYGGYRVIYSGGDGGQFVSFMAAFLLAYEPAKRLVRIRIDLESSIFGVRMLYELLDSPATEPPESAKPDLNIDKGFVQFSDVTFGYRTKEPVLRSLSFTAEAGKVTALVGESGGGKSTAFGLFLRLYEPWSGSIRIDGQDIASVDRRSLRAQIAYVSQDVFLFRGSIAENIAVGKPGASEDEIVAAAKAAYAHGFILALPSGYQTPVGEHGLELSTGQRQRVSIARALLRQAPIILLDEPTSALDAQSEREVQLAMAKLCANRTTLVIAHRLHTVVGANQIHVVENGTVVESGRHEELLRLKCKYAAFHDTHLKGDEPPPLEAV